MRTQLLAAVVALTLGGVAVAQEEPAAEAPPAAEVPASVPEPAAEPEPIPAPVKAFIGDCLPSLKPVGARCGVVGSGTLASAEGLTWQLYEIARRGERRGLSVLLANGQVVDTTPVPDEQLDRWAQDPYVMASVVKLEGQEYAAVVVPGDDRPAGFSLLRHDGATWTPVDSTGLWPAATAKLQSVMGAQCYPITTDMSWRAFSLRYGMISDDGNCGSVILGLGVQNGAVVVTDAMAVKPDLTPVKRRRTRR